MSCVLYASASHREIRNKDGLVCLPLMLNHLARDGTRNDLIARHVLRFLGVGRHTIVLSDRISQLTHLRELLLGRGATEAQVAMYIGATKAEARATAATAPCILSTYSMAKEGLDIPRLDTLVLATPKGDIVQAVGRVQRRHPDKHTPLVFDVVDTFSVFEQLRWKRWRAYREQGFQCQTYDYGDASPPWYC